MVRVNNLQMVGLLQARIPIKSLVVAPSFPISCEVKQS